MQAKAAHNRETALSVIAETLGRVQYGSIAVTVHDGKIVQLDITEKRRLGY
jgi:hypothetical protein